MVGVVGNATVDQAADRAIDPDHVERFRRSSAPFSR
jgi:hypothetical protein